MGTSRSAFRPFITLQVQYRSPDGAINARVEEILQEIYLQDPWKNKSGLVESFSFFITDYQHGTQYGDFRTRGAFEEEFRISSTQQAAFDSMAERIAETFCYRLRELCSSGSVQLNVDYESIDGKIYVCL